MTRVLSSLPATEHAELLIGFGTSDDAGVYRIDADKALVLTADFITPPVDDARVYGEIAAANALSDVYAMGGTPLACLHLACFPTATLDEQILVDILAGSMSKVAEAGAVVAGGHTVEDEEPKFGLSVTGMVHPDRIWTNHGARAGDKLILTKPVGSGVLFNANLKGYVTEDALSKCIDQLVRLNDISAGVFKDYEIHAVTDISGFGLAGHGFEMASASNVTLHINASQIPLFDEALAMYERGITTGVNKSNREMIADGCSFGSLPKPMQELMLDPQTSGGLLVSIAADDAAPALEALHRQGVEAARIIGEVSARDGQWMTFTAS